MTSSGSADPHDESEAERADRNLGELLQELRVAGLGVQVLFGFCSRCPLPTGSPGSAAPAGSVPGLPGAGRGGHGAAAWAGRLPPAVFRRGQKESLVQAASVMAIAGLVTVGLAVSVAVLLVASFVTSSTAAGLITALIACMFGLLWFAFPLTRR